MYADILYDIWGVGLCFTAATTIFKVPVICVEFTVPLTEKVLLNPFWGIDFMACATGTDTVETLELESLPPPHALKNNTLATANKIINLFFANAIIKTSGKIHEGKNTKD